MSLFVFLAILAAALLHASWNALVKSGGDKLSMMAMVAVSNGAMGLVVALMLPMPAPEVWPWIVASGLIRTIYYIALGAAYGHGDLSRVYPIARGAAPLMVLLAGFFVLPDALAFNEVAGLVVLGAGILFMARGVFTDGESARLIPLALLSAAATAAYSVTDGLGARLMQDGVAFTGWALAVTALFYAPVIVAMKGRQVLAGQGRGAWASGLFAGAASYVAYSIVVWAMTRAPIALVAGLRESSILFAVLLGWLLMGESMRRTKAISALLILIGAVFTRL